MGALALPLMLVGTAVSAIGTIAGGSMAADQAKQAAAFKAQQLNVAASDARSQAQAQAEERRRNARLALSTIQARVAGSGGDTTDQGIIDLSGKVGGRGEYQALSEMAAGENRARGLEDSAKAALWQGDSDATMYKTNSYFKAGGTLLSGLGGMFSTYAPGGGDGGFTPYQRMGGPLVINQYG